MKKRIFAALLAVGMALAGCSSTTTQGQKYVAVIAKSVNSDFFRNMKNGVESAATEYNVRVTFEGPENEEDYLSQNALIANAVKNGADAILLSSIDYHKTNDAVSEAVKNGVSYVKLSRWTAEFPASWSVSSSVRTTARRGKRQDLPP